MAFVRSFVRENWKYLALGALFAGAIIVWRLRDARRAAYDGDHWVAEATAEARDWRSDAQLVHVEANGVGPDGKMRGDPHWLFDFSSASLTVKPPDGAVLGAPPPPSGPRCFIYIVSMQNGARGGESVWARGEVSASCGSYASQTATTPARCSIKKVWERAKAAGAPTPAFANIEMKTSGGARTWHFEIMDYAKSPARTAFKLELPDDC